MTKFSVTFVNIIFNNFIVEIYVYTNNFKRWKKFYHMHNTYGIFYVIVIKIIWFNNRILISFYNIYICQIFSNSVNIRKS